MPGDPVLRARSDVPAPRTLLVVTSDTCEGCRRIVGAWKELLARLPVREGDEAILASFNGVEIVNELIPVARSNGFRVRRLMITQQSVFVLTTGLSSTPATALLDHDSRLRFITPTLETSVYSMLLSTWNSLGGDSAITDH